MDDPYGSLRAITRPQGDRDKRRSGGRTGPGDGKERKRGRGWHLGSDEGKWKGKTLVKGTTGVGHRRGAAMPVAGEEDQGFALCDVRASARLS